MKETLHSQIKEEMKESLRAKDTVRLTTLRGLLSAFTNELVATKRKPDEQLNDEEVLSVITRATKQRKDSIEQFKKGGRDDLAKNEEVELSILEKYLPEMMSEDDIKKVVEDKKKELGIDDEAKIGMLLGAVMKDLKGKADGSVVKKIAESLF